MFQLALIRHGHGFVWLADLFAPLNRPPQIAEEYDSATSLIAAVEAGRGVALVLEPLKCFIGPRVKIRALVPPPPALVIGIAWRKEANSPATENFIASYCTEIGVSQPGTRPG